MRKIPSTLAVICLITYNLHAQSTLPNSCKLEFGINLGGLSDYGTELPFVDLMHNCRSWYTKECHGTWESPWNTGVPDSLEYRPDGYPTYLPQIINGQSKPQVVATIWAATDGWPAGTYTVFYDGEGSILIQGSADNVQQITANKMTFDLTEPQGSNVELIIDSSAVANPIHNIRVIMPGHEDTYETEPFNPVWINKLSIFKTVRFMDWGHTNNWGQRDDYSWEDTSMFSWADRQQMDHYTWADYKGIPYEMMVKLMNDFDLDGWVCVPCRANNNYLYNMATLFKTQLETGRKLHVEYSNEIWNWMFGQTNWLNQYGCIDKGISWPEGTVPYIQNCFDQWTSVYGNDSARIVRVVGVQGAWQDVSNRIVFNLRPGTFDAFAPAAYFGLSESGDAALDALGTSATVADVAYWARKTWADEGKGWLTSQKETIADALNIPMLFYEGGQHLTPAPFGQEPTYAQALTDIQRDTAMYNLYNQWFDFLRSLQSGDNPILLMTYSFIGQRSAQYGSWGILETMDQDTSAIPAPKYKSIVKNINDCKAALSTDDIEQQDNHYVTLYPNPARERLLIHSSNKKIDRVLLFNVYGQLLQNKIAENTNNISLDLSFYSSGIYFTTIWFHDGTTINYKVIKQE